MIQRRSFLAGILAAGVAPAAVGSGILMPVRRIVTPTLGMDFSFHADKFVIYERFVKEGVVLTRVLLSAETGLVLRQEIIEDWRKPWTPAPQKLERS